VSAKKGYSIQMAADQVMAVGVSSLGEGRYQVEDMLRHLDSQAPDQTLARAVGKAKGPLTVVLEGKEIQHSVVSLPRLRNRELKRAVTGWVAREEGLAQDDVHVAWQTLAADARRARGGKQDIFLAYTGKAEVETRLAQARQYGGDRLRLLPDYLILDQFMRRHGPSTEGLQAWNLVYLGAKERFLCVCTPDSLFMTRNLPEDLSRGTDTEEYLSRLATEVERSVFFARQTEHSPVVEKVFVTGQGTLAAGLVDKLGDTTELASEFWDLDSHFSWGLGLPDSELVLAAVGAALSFQPQVFNLLPDVRHRFWGPTIRRRLTVGGSAMAAAVVPLLLVGGFFTVRVQDGYLDSARDRLDEANDRAEVAADVYRAQHVLLARETHIRRFTTERRDMESLMVHLAGLAPRRVVFKDLQLKDMGDGQYQLHVAGESSAILAEDAQAAFLDFMNAMAGSPWLESMGEPRKLEMITEDAKGKIRNKVVFALNYRLRDGAREALAESATPAEPKG